MLQTDVDAPGPMLKVVAPQAFAEHSVVRLRADLAVDGHVYPAGTVGTIVHVYGDHEAYEVELFEPASAVVTMGPFDLVQ